MCFRLVFLLSLVFQVEKKLFQATSSLPLGSSSRFLQGERPVHFIRRFSFFFFFFFLER